MTETDPLLEAVEALTKPRVTGIAQKNTAGRWERVHQIKHEPLLTQMRNAVWPSGENNGGATTPASERIPIDSTMLLEYAKIASQITSWAVSLDLKPTRDPIRDLHQWYATITRERDWDPAWHIRRLRGWAHHIERLLEKPKSFIVEAACPICGATEWGNMFDGGGLYPIKIEYVIDETGLPQDHTALCQACKTVWEGREAVEELADELNEKGNLSA